MKPELFTKKVCVCVCVVVEFQISWMARVASKHQGPTWREQPPCDFIKTRPDLLIITLVPAREVFPWSGSSALWRTLTILPKMGKEAFKKLTTPWGETAAAH